jgi:transcriptional regulator with XRE-family HTH domain
LHGNKPSIGYLIKVAQKFNVSIEWLLLGIDNVNNHEIEYLRMAWNCGDAKMKNWLEIQFQKCFPDYLEQLQKKRKC